MDGLMGVRWLPAGTARLSGRPEPGRLLALAHAVWRVVKIDEVGWDDLDAHAWQRAGSPLAWPGTPYKVYVVHVAGAIPDLAAAIDGDGAFAASMVYRPWQMEPWWAYPESGRWPVCSCCGQPVPCQAELADRIAEQHAARMRRLDAKAECAGCWACGQPVTVRQHAVVYDGENLDLPTAQGAVFHLRRSCRSQAMAYERRWIAQDPRRERVLTWPYCPGYLIVHADGSSQCVTDTFLRGRTGQPPMPDCRGHLTHDHRSMGACYLSGGGCERGCPREGHPGTRTSGRPQRRRHT